MDFITYIIKSTKNSKQNVNPSNNVEKPKAAKI